MGCERLGAPRARRFGPRALAHPRPGLGRGYGRRGAAVVGARCAGARGQPGIEPGSRLDAEVGYGFSVLGGRAVATPNAGWSRSGESETVRLGQRMRFGASQWSLESAFAQDARELRAGYSYRLGNALDLSLEATRREPANDDAPEHGVMLRAGVRW